MAGRIVVGVDGSEHAAAALRWAVDEAALREATVEAVHAWSFAPLTTPGDAGLVPLAWNEAGEAHGAMRDAAERVARDLVRTVLGADHGVTVSVVESDAGDALLLAAEDADLLVVGNRGRGSLAQLLLGSTSARLSDRAPCPVVVVRAYEEE